MPSCCWAALKVLLHNCFLFSTLHQNQSFTWGGTIQGSMCHQPHKGAKLLLPWRVC